MKSFSAVLYLEDDPMQRELQTRLYHTCRHCFHEKVSIITASSWEAGLSIIRSQPVDVAIVDLTLPPLGHEDTLRLLHSTPDLPPFVVLTGNLDPDLRRQSFASGADDFFSKQSVNHRPEEFWERVYHSFLRRNR
jgi:CheY-like chemotaxis protein